MKLTELKDALRSEWRATHHNGYLMSYCVDCPDEYANGVFEGITWEGIYIVLPEIQKEILTKYHENLTLCTFGRGGATVAPSEWVRDYDMTLMIDDGEGLEYYNQLRKVLAILQLINTRCNEWRNSLHTRDWHDFVTNGCSADDDCELDFMEVDA